MCLTEPQAGSSLSDVKTTAVKARDGDYYLLTGTKCFISSGDHDLTENIVHPVLAKLAGRTARGQGHQLVHRSEVPHQAGRLGRRVQRRGDRRHRAQAGPARQRDGHAELRRERRLPRLADGRAEQRPRVHVPADEQRAHRHGRAGDRGRVERLPARTPVREGTAAGARHHREGSDQASDLRSSSMPTSGGCCSRRRLHRGHVRPARVRREPDGQEPRLGERGGAWRAADILES